MPDEMLNIRLRPRRVFSPTGNKVAVVHWLFRVGSTASPFGSGLQSHSSRLLAS